MSIAKREQLSATITGDWMARCVAANQTAPHGVYYFTDDMGPLDAPQYIACGGVSRGPTMDVVHAVSREAA